jgi:nicotinic acid mononucleotide adenylyltransferase
MGAFQRAIKLNGLENADHLIGVGASCSLAKDNERVGREHHAYIAVQTAATTRTYELGLTGLNLNRVTEEGYCSLAIILALGYACKTEDRVVEKLMPVLASEVFDNGNNHLFSLLTGQLSDHVVRFVHAQQHPVIFAGSFNPFHEQHGNIAAKVHEITGSLVDLEVCVHNVDKPALNYTSLRERRVGLENLADKPWLGNIHFTALPTFQQKALHFYGATFVVGWDTFKRICDPKYGNLEKVITTFQEQDIKFLVFHRAADGKVSTDENTDGFPWQILKMAQIIPPDVLPPVDMSSSEIRKNKP